MAGSHASAAPVWVGSPRGRAIESHGFWVYEFLTGDIVADVSFASEGDDKSLRVELRSTTMILNRTSLSFEVDVGASEFSLVHQDATLALPVGCASVRVRPVHGGATRNAYPYQKIDIDAGVQPISLVSGSRSFSFVVRPAEGVEALQYLRNAADGTYGDTEDSGNEGEAWLQFSQAFKKYVRVVSIDAPMTVCNLLASPVQYRLRGFSSSLATTDGYLPSGAALRWHSPGSSQPVKISFRLSGFSWSEYCALPSRATSQRSVQLHVDVRDRNAHALRLTVDVDISRGGVRDVALSVPSWIINKSGISLLFRTIDDYSPWYKLLTGRSSSVVLPGQVEEIMSQQRRRVINSSQSSSKGLFELLEDTGMLPPALVATPLEREGDTPPSSCAAARTLMVSSSFRVSMRTAGTHWSPPVALDLGSTVELRAGRKRNDQRLFCLAAVPSKGKGRFGRTTVTTFYAQITLVNALQSKRTITVRQAHLAAASVTERASETIIAHGQEKAGIGGMRRSLDLCASFSRVLDANGQAAFRLPKMQK